MKSEKRDLISQVLVLVLLALLVIWSFRIISPFILIFVWGLILAVGLYPPFQFLLKKLGDGKRKLLSILFGLVITLLMLGPAVMIGKSIASTSINTLELIKTNQFEIPKPDESVKDWPFIGEKLHAQWTDLSKDIPKYIEVHQEFILEQGTNVLSGFKGFFGSFFTFFFAFFVALIFIFHADRAYSACLRFTKKLIGDRAEELVLNSRDVIRSVLKGIVLVALIQTGLAFIGFKAMDLPGTGIFTILMLIAALVQIPTMLILLPAIVLAFSSYDTLPAVIFTIYSFLVGISDNILKPILMGKGLKVPMIVVLIGTIGGLLLHGIVGLFIGAIVLSLTFNIIVFWMNDSEKA